jgi:hypothetical protein
VTEQEWLDCTDPTPMLEFLRGKMSDRKLRLFAVACCRRIWPLMADWRSRVAVETAEKYADGNATESELRESHIAAEAASDDALTGGNAEAADAATAAAELVADCTSCAIAAADADYSARYTEYFAQAGVLRDIIGNPFHPVPFSPSWCTDTALSLARQMYESRDSGAMPILADALQDAGCEDADILNHCRSDGPHVRGCWVVDLLLGKE